MRRELDAETPAPAWPPGLTVRAFVPGQDDAATHALISEAFSDLPNYTPSSLDDWRTRLMHPGLFKPQYWYLAFDGATLAGCALCYSFPEAGWLGNLAVRAPYRHHGLGLALLHHSFAEFRRTGHPALELGVDAANATGATRVYERAGMHIARKSVIYEKLL
jgi:mycothiol synthase